MSNQGIGGVGSSACPGRGEPQTPLAVFYVDSGPSSGLGHVSRCEAIAEALVDLGWGVGLTRPLALPAWACEAYPLLTSSPLVPECGIFRGSHIHVYDSYMEEAKAHQAKLTCTGRVLWLQDTGQRVPFADLVVNPNVGASHAISRTSSRTAFRCRPRWVGGGAYTPIRKSVRAVAESPGWALQPPSPTRIIVSTGGASQRNAANYIVRRLSDLCLPVVVIVPAGESSDRLLQDSDLANADFAFAHPTPHLTDLIRPGDVALLTSGTTMWDMFLLNVPVNVTTTNDIQRSTVNRLKSLGLVNDLGALLDWDQSGMRTLESLCTQAELRTAQAYRARASLDGRGSHRIAERAQALLEGRS